MSFVLPFFINNIIKKKLIEMSSMFGVCPVEHLQSWSGPVIIVNVNISFVKCTFGFKFLI